MSMPTGFIESKPETLPTDKLLSALSQARYLHERLLVAYYKEGGGRAYHMRGAHEALREAAHAMGYALELIAQDDQQAA